jgi:cyclase
MTQRTSTGGELEQIAPGVFAYVQRDGSWFINNTGLLVSGGSVICIDACSTERRTRAFLEAIATVTPRSVDTLICTHHHPDHTNGNALIGAAQIIAHTRCREEMGTTIITPPPGVFEPVEWGELEVALPTLCFDLSIELFVEDRRIELLHLGTAAHTTNDIIAWLPHERILFAGDLAFNGGTPFALSGSVAGWLETLDRLAVLEPEFVVPGHGDVGGPELLTQTGDYLRFVQEAASPAHAAGQTPLEAARELDLGAFAHLTDRERIVGNLQRAFAELDGAPRGVPLEVGPAFAGMVAYNGGHALHCCA